MKISESNVVMSSTSQFSAKGLQTMRVSRAFEGQSTAALANTRDSYVGGYPDNDFLGTYEKYANENIDGNPLAGGIKGSALDLAKSDLAQLRNQLIGDMYGRFSNFGAFGPNAGNPVRQIMTYSEEESATFSASGRELTEDGRVIDFNIDVAMTRSYMEYMDISIPAVSGALMDPLMVNVSSGVANISDQKFKFDLDADGIEESISMLGKGTGFLALDLNEDGIINDGRELFGTKSGDGFEDLRQYDSDGNGWIDENDEIFDRLKIWYKNDAGEDVLMNLKEADIGAIYLGEQSTDFSLYGAAGMNGMIRSTGFFLKESGGAGTVQHVDLVAGSDMKDNTGISSTQNTAEEEAPSVILVNGLDSNTRYFSVENKSKDETEVKKNSASKRSEARKEAELRRQKIQLKKREFREMLEKKRMERKEERDRQIEKILENNIERKEKAGKVTDSASKEHSEEVAEMA